MKKYLSQEVYKVVTHVSLAQDPQIPNIMQSEPRAVLKNPLLGQIMEHRINEGLDFLLKFTRNQ